MSSLLRSTLSLPMWSRKLLTASCSASGSYMQDMVFPQQQQIRSRMTKTKRRRLEKKERQARNAARGIFPAKPPNYISKRNNVVVNAIPREERNQQARQLEEEASKEMHRRRVQQSQKEPLLRFHFEGLVMSDRVRKLFDLTNGNQKEVIKAQKQRGMELFQLREGDTGSSAVQVIALTTRIQQLQTHMRTHRKDKSSKRGLDALYVRRRKVLDYMERKDFESYRRVVKTLGLVR